VIGILSVVLRLISEALAGRKSDEEIAKELITAAFDSGIPAAVLMQHLTELGRERAELAADIAQFLKVGPR
jgi:hypothetical protein